MGAGRVWLKRLQNPQEALKCFMAADNSPVPHLDMEHSIQAGIREARAALEGALVLQAAKTTA
jgi:hypothetical protein